MSEVVLSVRQLRARYAVAFVLDGVDLEVSRGEWLTLLGPNAAGKTTLLHAIVGYVTPVSGSIAIAGYSTDSRRPNALRQLGFASPPDKLPALLTGRQCLEIYAAAKQLERVDDETLGLASELRFERFLDQYVNAYSLGTRQKLSVLLAFLGNPSLLVLDEVFNGLDPASSLALKRHIRARVDAGKCGVILATHALDMVEHYADRAALMLNGRIIRTWSKDELKATGFSGAERLETVLAQASQFQHGEQ